MHPLRKALDFKVDGRRGRGRSKKMWKNQVEEELRKEDAPNRSRWREGVQAIAARVRRYRPPPNFGDKTELKLDQYYYYYYLRHWVVSALQSSGCPPLLRHNPEYSSKLSHRLDSPIIDAPVRISIIIIITYDIE